MEVTQTIAYLVETQHLDAAIKFAFEQEENRPSAELSLYILYLLARKGENAELIIRSHLLSKIEEPFKILEKLLSLLSNKGRFDLVIEIFKKVNTGAKTVNLNVLNAQALTMLGFYDQAEKELRKIHEEKQSTSFSLGISKLALKAKAPQLAIEVAAQTQNVADTENVSRLIDIALAKKQLGNLDGAVKTLSKLDPNQNREIAYLLTRLHIDMKNFHLAEYFLESVLCVKENSDEQLINLMWDFLSAKGDGQKLRAFAELVQETKKTNWSNKLLIKTYHVLGLKEEKAQQVEQDLAVSHYWLASKAMTSLYKRNITETEVFDTHINAAKRFNSSQNASLDIPVGRRIRIGYLSSDFKQHSVFYFLYPVLKNHSISKVEIFAYYSGKKFDAYTQKIIEVVNHWRPVAHLDTDALVEVIRNDKIDCLIDLNGNSEGNRLDAIAQRSAKIQATWIGYPATTGVQNMDYRFTDNYVDDIPTNQKYYVESLVPLSDTNFSVYLPPLDAPEITELPAIRNGHITFGSFNNFVKIDEETLEGWADILSSIDNSRLLIKNKSMHYDCVRKKIYETFGKRGIERERILIAAKTTTVNEHLKSISSVDISLDTYPYSGTTTTCESLWMGVPVITLKGNNHRSRVSAGLLNMLNMNNFIADTREEYLLSAIENAGNLKMLSEVRLNLRAVMRNSPLMQYKEFTVNLENTIKKLCETK